MRLVGATPISSTAFHVEGILYGALAVALSFIFLYIITSTIRIESSNLWAYYEEINLQKIFFYELAAAVAMAGISSFTAVQQYIKGNFHA